MPRARMYTYDVRTGQLSKTTIESGIFNINYFLIEYTDPQNGETKLFIQYF